MATRQPLSPHRSPLDAPPSLDAALVEWIVAVATLAGGGWVEGRGRVRTRHRFSCWSCVRTTTSDSVNAFPSGSPLPPLIRKWPKPRGAVLSAEPTPTREPGRERARADQPRFARVIFCLPTATSPLSNRYAPVAGSESRSVLYQAKPSSIPRLPSSMPRPRPRLDRHPLALSRPLARSTRPIPTTGRP